MRYFLPLILALATCFGLQSVALKAVGGRTTKSESNYFSSIARIQNGIRTGPDISLLGSSRIARLPEWSSDGRMIANMGCDGGSAAITLRAIDQNIIPPAHLIVIEGNTLLHDLEQRGWEISQALHSPWFRIGVHFPLLSATGRPSAFVYSKLLSLKTGDADHHDGPVLPVSSHATPYPQAQEISESAELLIEEITPIFDRLKAQGIRILLVILPPGTDEDSLNIKIPRELSRRTSTPLLDLTDGLPDDAVHYTDGVHMTPESAAAALRTILLSNAAR